LLDVYLVRLEILVNSCTIEQGICDHCGLLLEVDLYLFWLESLVNSCTIEQGISNRCGLLLEVEWEENYW
jgi:hypothetical protein